MTVRVFDMLRLGARRTFQQLNGLKNILGYASEASKKPQEKASDPSIIRKPAKIDSDTIALLETLSLVDRGDKKGIKVLEDAVNFADAIHDIDTEGVEPMYTVLEDSHLFLREDAVTEGDCQKDVLKNAAVTEEDYFVAPPGNVAHRPSAPKSDE